MSWFVAWDLGVIASVLMGSYHRDYPYQGWRLYALILAALTPVVLAFLVWG